jgi:multicomponent Na+:H+ antiporter subunit A
MTLVSISPEPFEVRLKLFPGINTALVLTFVSLIFGLLMATQWRAFRRVGHALWRLSERLSPEAGYFAFMDGIARFAQWQTRIIQNGRLGVYMIVLILATTLPVAITLLRSVGLPEFSSPLNLTLYEWVMVMLMVIATGFAVITQSRFASIIALGALGFSVALIFVHFSAPDLGITQVLVETLTVLLLVLVLVKVPGFSRYSSRMEVFRDAAVAIFAGMVLSAVVMAAIPVQWAPTISSYFIENSYELGKGRNIVNVILVDFRALDTLGEIFVLAIAALGVYSMMKLKGDRHGE